MRRARPCLIIAALIACEPTGVDQVETVELTLHLQLASGYDIGPTPGRVYVYTDSQPVPRAFAFPEWAAEVCVLARTPVTTCIVNVPRFGPVSLIAAEPDPAVFVTFAPKSPQDTARDGRYVEFTGWTECPDRAERGLCVIRPSNSLTIEGNFQLAAGDHLPDGRRAHGIPHVLGRTDAQGSGGELQHPRLRRLSSLRRKPVGHL
jgi:hypothetical protein